MQVSPLRIFLALACALACLPAAPAHAVELTPPWGYAAIDDRPFQTPSGAYLPSTQAYPRGVIRDTVKDGKDVRLTVWAFSSTSRPLAQYSIEEGDFVNVSIDKPLDVAPNVIPYLRFDFCVFNSSGISCLPSEYIGRPDPPLQSPPGGGGPPPPPGTADLDADGHLAPADCDDRNSTVHPGAPERPANGMDDDCAGGDQPGRVTAGIVTSWAVQDGRTRVRRLAVRDAPAGAIVEVRCRGARCPWRKRAKGTGANGAARLTRWFARRLRAGVRLEVRVTAPNAIGKVVRYRVRRGRLPASRRLCLPPGASKPARC
jgi:hypothetical protein